MSTALVRALYNVETIDQWEHDKTMQHSSGIWGRKPVLDYLRHQVLQPGDAVVDLGAGAGYPSYQISQLVGAQGHVIGIELNEVMAAAARRRYAAKNLQFETCDVTKRLPLPSASIEVVTSFMMLHNLLSTQLHALFSEVARILRPGGSAVFLTMHPDAFESDWDLKFLCYDQDALGRYRAALEPEDLEIPGIAMNAAGGENAIVTLYHARASVLAAVHAADLVLADEQDLWIDALTAVEIFGSDAIRRLPQTAIYWMIVLKRRSAR